MIIALLLITGAAVALICWLRIQTRRLRNLDWPTVMTRRAMSSRIARYLQRHGWRVVREDDFADIIIHGIGISVAFLVRADKILTTDLMDAGKHRVLSNMPFGVLVNFPVEEWRLAEFRSRSILLMHYTELPDFLTIFDATTENLPENLRLYARADQRLSLFMGQKLLRLGRVGGAIEWLENAVECNPKTAQLSTRALIGAYLANQQPQPAYDVALRINRFLPDSEHILPSLGDLALRVGDYAAAETWTRRAIMLDPANAGLYRRLSQIENLLGHPEASEEALRKAEEYSSS